MFGTQLRKILFWFFSVVFLFFSVAFFVFFCFGQGLPSEQTLFDYFPPQTTKIFSSEGDLIEEYAIEHRSFVPFKKIPLIVKGAFLIAEDQEFYNHAGISIQSLLRAVIENTARKSWNKKPAGGSTITQQIAKNLLVGNERSITRKITEAIMAFRIESSLSKNKILEIYLNQLYLGKGCYGISEAANSYFGKSIEQLLPAEAAFLASIPSAPSVYINALNSPKLITKRNSILYKMYESGYITQAQLKTAIDTPISIMKQKPKFWSPYFSDEVFRIFSDAVSRDEFFKRGFYIKTTMNKSVQKMLTEAFEDELINFDKTKKWDGTIENIQNNMKSYKEKLQKINKTLPNTINSISACVVEKVDHQMLTCLTIDDKIKIEIKEKDYKNVNIKVGDIILFRKLPDSNEIYQTPKVSGGAVVMDLDNGNILGMTGGFSFDISPFNCVTQAKRQPGSTIKPFVYAAAIENGMDEYDQIDDKPVTVTLSNGQKYSPHNYDQKCYGKTPLRDGLIYSRNLSTINLALKIGLPSISSLLKSAELIKTKLPISGVLGSVEVVPLKLISAFSAFFNNGVMIYPRFIESISQNQERKIPQILQKLTTIQTKKIVSKKTAETIKNILIDASKFGTSSKLNSLREEYEIELGGKTGSTNNFKDAWFIGYFSYGEKKYIVGVFVGYQIPASLGDRNTGARVALPVFQTFVKKFIENSKNSSRN